MCIQTITVMASARVKLMSAEGGSRLPRVGISPIQLAIRM